MRQVLVSGGQVYSAEVPAPRIESGCVLIAMDHSCISVGTEMSGIKASAAPLWRRALRQPQHVKKVMGIAFNEGVLSARRQVKDRVSVELPSGYSGAGVVLEVGDGVREFAPGDRVACAGAQCAYHAEVVLVPKNLVVHVPKSVGLDVASSVALGAIALQGVRRAAPTLGETFVVIGLGILGQLAVQMLRANGCRVIGTDLDRSRIEFGMAKGMNFGVHPDDVSDVDQVARLTGGLGADGVIITAASPSDAIVSTAFQMCRKKARVVLVGDVGLDLKRSDFYEKELDFLISSSYGPGRYDRRYEEQGLDYPAAYVRWTEGRNMQAYLDLIADGSLDVASMVDAVYPLDEVGQAYASLQAGTRKPLMVLLAYPNRDSPKSRRINLSAPATESRSGAIQVALIGAGGFAKTMHLPNLQSLNQDYELGAVVSRSGHNAATTARRFGARYCTTDHREVLADPGIHAVIIATRHDSHSALALESLKAGKHVLVEKPLALDEEGLQDIEAFYAMSGEEPKPLLMTGFNRRFSPYAERIADLLKDRTHPLIINYRMNAGYIPSDHWVHSAEGGGRNRGEACHIYDLFTFIVGGRVTQVKVAAIKSRSDYYGANDNFVATIIFEDGSVATLTYTSLGHVAHPKETMDIFVDGKVISLEDYRRLTIAGARVQSFQTRIADKGQKAELQAFARAVRGDAQWPIPLWQQIQATRIANEVEAQIACVGSVAEPVVQAPI